MNPDDMSLIGRLSNQIQNDLTNDSYRVKIAPDTLYTTAGASAITQLHAEAINASASMSQLAAQHKALEVFREHYTKVRMDNIALSQEAAIEIVKMVLREAPDT